MQLLRYQHKIISPPPKKYSRLTHVMYFNTQKIHFTTNTIKYSHMINTNIFIFTYMNALTPIHIYAYRIKCIYINKETYTSIG